MSAIAGFFVCKGEYRVYFCFAHDICVYLVTVLEMFGNKFGDTFLMGSFKTNCFCVIFRVGGFEHFLHCDRCVKWSVFHCFYEKLWVIFCELYHLRRIIPIFVRRFDKVQNVSICKTLWLSFDKVEYPGGGELHIYQPLGKIVVIFHNVFIKKCTVFFCKI